MKDTLKRLMETSNVAVAKKLLRTERGLRQHFRITNCRGNLNTQLVDLKPSGKPENITETSTCKWEKYSNKQFEENVKVNRRIDKRFNAEKYCI